MKRILLIIAAFAALGICGTSLRADSLKKAVLTEGSTTMLTYDFSDPDPVANPDHLQYPYFRFDGYEATGKQKTWKTVVLENEWIQVTLFPEVGGKVWGAIDKTNGKEFVYYNHVVKFRDIAMRGAWTSGGIEFNFGIIGHVPSTATPVDYATRENADGSVSCFIASYELLTRTWWTVEVNVPADKAYFTTSVIYVNTSPLEQPYYNWMNAAFKAEGNLQLCMPGDRYIGHGGDPHPYPIDKEGRDLSWYSQNAFGRDKSYHLVGGYDDFFGAYWHDEGYGYAHCARPDEKLGRKVFQWSHSREGGIWEDLLTDTDGQYVEMQAGRMFNQPSQEQSIYTPFKHHSFAPAANDTWNEYWYPVETIGAFQEATPFGALSLDRTGDGKAVVKVSPVAGGTRKVRVTCDGKEIYSADASFSPLKVWTATVPAPEGRKIKVVVGDNDIVFDEDPGATLTGRPDTMPSDFDWNTAYGHCLKADQYMNIRFYDNARKEYEASLAKDKWFVPALRGMASFCLHCGLYEEAYDYAKKVLSVNTYDGEANYLYGMAAMRTGRLTDAKDGFSIATYTSAVRDAAYAGLAGTALSEKDWALALTYAEKSGCVAGTMAKLVALRHMGKAGECRSILEAEAARIPLFPLYNFERGLLAGDPASFTGTLKCELPQETILECAVWYLDNGLLEEADALCALTDYPTAKYLKACIAGLKGDGPVADRLLAEANASSPSFVFPFRPELLPVFDWAAGRKPDWKLNYYRALIRWRHAGKDQARELFEACGDEPDYSPFYLTRAMLRKGDGKLADLRKAESMNPDWRTGRAVVEYYMSNADWATASAEGEKYFKKYPDKFELGLDYAESLCGAGKYAKSLKVLSALQVMPKEGAHKGHQIYRRACLGKAIEELRAGKFAACIKSVEASRIWDERLGVGKPYEDQIDTFLEDKIVEAAKAKNRNLEINSIL